MRFSCVLQCESSSISSQFIPELRYIFIIATSVVFSRLRWASTKCRNSRKKHYTCVILMYMYFFCLNFVIKIWRYVTALPHNRDIYITSMAEKWIVWAYYKMLCITMMSHDIYSVEITDNPIIFNSLLRLPANDLSKVRITSIRRWPLILYTYIMTSSNGNISALLAMYAWNTPVTGEFPAQRPITRSFDVFFDLRLNERLSKQSWGWWFKTPSRSLQRHSNVEFPLHNVPSRDHCFPLNQMFRMVW